VSRENPQDLGRGWGREEAGQGTEGQNRSVGQLCYSGSAVLHSILLAPPMTGRGARGRHAHGGRQRGGHASHRIVPCTLFGAVDCKIHPHRL
jgi:hypothetical protein